MKILLSCIFCLFSMAVVEASGHHPVDYSLPDITVQYDLHGRTTILEAYKLSDKLQWVSIGRPYFVKSENSSYILTSPEAIRAQIRLLDSPQKQALLDAVRARYTSATIHENQLGLIPLQKFTCKTELMENEKRWVVTGVVRDFGMVDTSMEFLGTRRGSLLRNALEARIRSAENLIWTCQLEAGGKESTAVLRISVSQPSWKRIQTEIFGGNTEIYISKQQLNRLAQRVRQETEIDEKYDYEDEEFETDFKERLLLVAGTNFQEIDIAETLGKLSKFEWPRAAKAVTSDEILSDWSDQIVIRTGDGDQQFIDIRKIKTPSHADHVTGLAAIRLSTGVTTSLSLVPNLKSRYYAWSTPIDHQIRELNWLSRDGIQWELRGDKLIPKSLNLLKLHVEDLQRDIVLSGVKLRLKDTKFSKTLELGGEFEISQDLIAQENTAFSKNLDSIREELAANLTKLRAELAHERQQSHRAIKLLQKQLSKEREDMRHIRRQLSREKDTNLHHARTGDQAVTNFRDEKHIRVDDTPHMYFPMGIDYTLDCKEFTNLNDDDYSWSSVEPQRDIHFGLKHVHCGQEYWFLHGIYWTEGFRVRNSANWHLHAEFRCCRLLFNVTGKGVKERP